MSKEAEKLIHDWANARKIFADFTAKQMVIDGELLSPMISAIANAEKALTDWARANAPKEEPTKKTTRKPKKAR